MTHGMTQRHDVEVIQDAAHYDGVVHVEAGPVETRSPVSTKEDTPLSYTQKHSCQTPSWLAEGNVGHPLRPPVPVEVDVELHA